MKMEIWKNDEAIGGIIQGAVVFIGRTIIGQTGIIGMIGSWLGA